MSIRLPFFITLFLFFFLFQLFSLHRLVSSLSGRKLVQCANPGSRINGRSTKVVAEAQKGSDVLNFGGRRPIFNSCNFDGVHACYPLFKDYPQVIHLWGMEGAFFWFEV
jgi:hypothetical protein